MTVWSKFDREAWKQPAEGSKEEGGTRVNASLILFVFPRPQIHVDFSSFFWAHEITCTENLLLPIQKSFHFEGGLLDDWFHVPIIHSRSAACLFFTIIIPFGTSVAQSVANSLSIGLALSQSVRPSARLCKGVGRAALANKSKTSSFRKMHIDGCA